MHARGYKQFNCVNLFNPQDYSMSHMKKLRHSKVKILDQECKSIKWQSMELPRQTASKIILLILHTLKGENKRPLPISVSRKLTAEHVCPYPAYPLPRPLVWLPALCWRA